MKHDAANNNEVMKNIVEWWSSACLPGRAGRAGGLGRIVIVEWWAIGRRMS